MLYLVTTELSHIPSDYQIIMVDGTVPGWSPRPQDLHWDHHRPQGADIQIDEMPFPSQTSLREELAGELPPCIVTPQLDADACCAAAWFQLPRSYLTPETVARLRAIAWDCDHLMVPAELSAWAEFAAKAVVALKTSGAEIAKELQLPKERKTWSQAQWEAYFSEGFKRGTEWLIAAAKGEKPWPGEQGEANNYRQRIERDACLLLEQNRIKLLSTPRGAIAIGDLRGIGHYIDPKSFNQAIIQLAPLEAIRPETLLMREHKYGGGIQYTLGCLPQHPQSKYLDYTAGTFERLTQAELAKDPMAQGWGGRRTVGGSGWNTPSHLAPEEVIALLD
ncbi:MAG: hypothetical protein D6756_05935 [Cyanobacteria bacterium J083]|nr:MAG: hypothetical protein D6756_05935 [Cyanobacteria bacterium J083]